MISAWARMCKIIGPGFVQYLPVVMGPLLQAASIKPEIVILDCECSLLGVCHYDVGTGWGVASQPALFDESCLFGKGRDIDSLTMQFVYTVCVCWCMLLEVATTCSNCIVSACIQSHVRRILLLLSYNLR